MSKECTDVEKVLENTDRKKIIPQVNISKSKRPGSSLKKVLIALAI